MRRSLVCLLLAAGCAAPAPEPATSAGLEACTAAVAEHVNLAPSALTATRVGVSPNGMNIIDVEDSAGVAGERVHRCSVDGAGQVHAILHIGV
jgi:hypothetical protein